MNDKSIFRHEPSNRLMVHFIPRREYSEEEKSMLMDYLYNLDFSEFDIMDGKEHYDSLDGERIIFSDGVFSDGEYMWGMHDPIYVAKHNLAVVPEFMEKVQRFYSDGKQIGKIFVDWTDASNLTRPKDSYVYCSKTTLPQATSQPQ